MKYRIGLVQTVYEETTLEIEAETQAAAEAEALRRAPNSEWRFMETADSPEIVSCENMTSQKELEPLYQKHRKRNAAESHVCEDCGTFGFGGWNCVSCGSHNIRMLD